MNCKSIQKYLYAFADGQLDVKVNCDVLDHLKMCPGCSGIVDEHQAVRMVLRKELDTVRIPEDLRDRVKNAIKQGRKTTDRPTRWRDGWPVRIVAAAACVGLVAIASRQSAGPGAEVDEISATVVSRHNRCCNDYANHQREDLPSQLAGLAEAISDRFASKIDGDLAAVAPDLSGHGYAFESANLCGIQNQECTLGGHVIYARADGGRMNRLSVFSVPRWGRLDEWSRAQGAGDASRPVMVAQGDGLPDMCIAVWNNGNTSYICCGVIDTDEMRTLARDVRVALADPLGPNIFAVLARH